MSSVYWETNIDLARHRILVGAFAQPTRPVPPPRTIL